MSRRSPDWAAAQLHQLDKDEAHHARLVSVKSVEPVPTLPPEPQYLCPWMRGRFGDMRFHHNFVRVRQASMVPSLVAFLQSTGFGPTADNPALILAVKTMAEEQGDYCPGCGMHYLALRSPVTKGYCVRCFYEAQGNPTPWPFRSKG